MDFATPLLRWPFARREKRFLLYGTEPDQIAHCANTGSMKGVLEHATHVWVRDYGAASGRKLRYGAELLEPAGGTLVCINTAHANTLAGEALTAGLVPGFPHVHNLQHEVKFSAATRFDWAFATPTQPRVWCEVKNVTMAEGPVALFPDAKTERGTKHLHTLAQLVQQGGVALQLYMVARADCQEFRPAEMIDPTYAAALHAAHRAGVVVVALGCQVTPQQINVCKVLPVVV
ncbi:MAG: DNA/RNA nuclease SfsA [Alphaproteobacteria bacterium]|nr:DNA/RNA nuclease SfsA [Alphaproteobacteria bacterium]